MKIVYSNADGTLLVVHPAPDRLLEDVIKYDIPEGASFKVVEDDAIPSQRDFRAAWKLAGSKIVEDLEVCKEIYKDDLRKKRAPLLADLDIALIRAIESGESTMPITKQKQALRDITSAPEIAKASTPDSLRELELL